MMINTQKGDPLAKYYSKSCIKYIFQEFLANNSTVTYITVMLTLSQRLLPFGLVLLCIYIKRSVMLEEGFI